MLIKQIVTILKSYLFIPVFYSHINIITLEKIIFKYNIYPPYSSLVTLSEDDFTGYEGTVTSDVSINFEDITICFGG